MRRIDKTIQRATLYEQKLREFDETGKDHPNYTQSPFRTAYYNDVFMSLLCCQGGVCAYTESLICNVSNITTSVCWENGKYEARNLEGNIEHFDSDLKKTHGWQWDNLFVVCSAINSKVKGKKKVDYILKPDVPGYDPFQLLTYDFDTHFFTPNPDLDDATAKKVREMIDTLGINFRTIVDRREERLESYRVDIHSGLKTYESLRSQLREFFTAFDMSREELEAA